VQSIAEHNKNIYGNANGVCIKFIDTLLRIVIAVRKVGGGRGMG